MISYHPKPTLVQKEVIARVYWGATDEEILEFLSTEHAVDGEEALQMLSSARQAKARAVRQKALLWLLFSLTGLGVAGIYFGIQGSVGFIVIGVGPILMAGLGLASGYLLVRSLYRLITGESDGSAH